MRMGRHRPDRTVPARHAAVRTLRRRRPRHAGRRRRVHPERALPLLRRLPSRDPREGAHVVTDPRMFAAVARARAACLAATSGYVAIDVVLDGDWLNLILQGPAGTIQEVAHCTLDTLMAITE